MGLGSVANPLIPLFTGVTLMSQQPDDGQTLVQVTVPAWMIPHVENLNELLQAVEALPPGGDLEGLIETHLIDLNRQCYDTALRHRAWAAERQVSEPSEDFPPSGLSSMPQSAAAWANQAAPDPDAAR
jgi:hypothetical protein